MYDSEPCCVINTADTHLGLCKFKGCHVYPLYFTTNSRQSSRAGISSNIMVQWCCSSAGLQPSKSVVTFDVEQCWLLENEDLKSAFQRPIPNFSEGGSKSNNSVIIYFWIIQLIQYSFKQKSKESINGNFGKPHKPKWLSKDISQTCQETGLILSSSLILSKDQTDMVLNQKSGSWSTLLPI